MCLPAHCFERTPYGSLIASILVLLGSGLMCGSNYEALRKIQVIFDDRFYPIPNLNLLQIIGIVYAVPTMIFALVDTLAGAAATGDTRRAVYGHKKSQLTGRHCSNALLCFTYFITVAWFLLFIAFAVPVTLWTMLHVVCRQETDYWRSISADKDETQFSYMFNLTHYGLYRRPLDTSLYSEYVNSPSAFTQLCQEVSTVGPLFVIALFASFLVIIGLNCFIACLSSNAQRLKFTHDIDQARFLPHTLSDGVTSTDDYTLQPLIRSQPPQLTMPPSMLDANARGNVFSYGDTVSLQYQPGTSATVRERHLQSGMGSPEMMTCTMPRQTHMGHQFRANN